MMSNKIFKKKLQIFSWKFFSYFMTIVFVLLLYFYTFNYFIEALNFIFSKSSFFDFRKLLVECKKILHFF